MWKLSYLTRALLNPIRRQFGNMLVLSAVYKSKHLGKYIAYPGMERTPYLVMKYLFNRTIALLGDLKPISPTLGQDALILSHLKDVVLKEEGEEAAEGGRSALSTSFSST